MFKNNKALNGHMRLHGGFDWTKRVRVRNIHVRVFVKYVCMHVHVYVCLILQRYCVNDWEGERGRGIKWKLNIEVY